MEAKFEQRMRQLLPYLDVRSITPMSDHSDDRLTRIKRRRSNKATQRGLASLLDLDQLTPDRMDSTEHGRENEDGGGSGDVYM